MTIFNTPVLSFVFHLLARFFMWLARWRIDGSLPDLPKYVLIGAPHTSSWDFILFLGLVFSLRANVRFMGKAELFRPPFGIFFRYCGGVAVDRAKNTGLVEQMVKASNESSRFILVLSPEGTRHYIAEWKSGFYRIATGAGIPVVMAVVDGKNRVVRVGQVFEPTGDFEGDLKIIKGYFEGAVGINPRRKYITLER